MLADIMDTGRTVATEDECEDFSYQIIMESTILDVHLALGTGMETFSHTTLADFAP